MNEDVKKIIQLAKEILEVADNLKYSQFGAIYKKECKNCGKKINVTRKNKNFCSDLCKEKYYKKQRHEYYEKYKQNSTDEELKKRNEKAKIRMRELRKKRSELL